MNNKRNYRIMSKELKDITIKKINSSTEWNVSPAFKDINPETNISIGFFSPFYLTVDKLQNKDDEYKKIKKFLKQYISRYSKIVGVPVEDLSLEFINYGQTELVYVLKEKNGRKTTLLVKQPILKVGKVKQEAKNLLTLNMQDNNVVAPIDYFKSEDQELYATPYINQARCVASYDSWGMYVPEPFYRFVPFSEEQEKIVTSCMIAKLISLYDFNSYEGIRSCKLGGGDFMLPKGWEKSVPTIENTLSNLYLISARDKIKCSFDDYLKLIRSEFSRRTIDENSNNLILNIRGRIPIKVENIESGISIGKSIIQEKHLNKNDKTQKTDDWER